MDNTSENILGYYLDLLKECRRKNIDPAPEVISDIQSDGFDVNQLWMEAGRLVFIEAMEDSVRALFKKANIKSPADIQTLKGTFSYINKDHLTNEEVDAIFDKVLNEYAQEYDTYVEELVLGKRSPDEEYFQRLIKILNISQEEAEQEIAQKKEIVQKQKEEERKSHIKPKFYQEPEFHLFVKEYVAVWVMILAAILFSFVIAIRGSYGFWGWIGIIYVSILAGEILGLIVKPLVHIILRKHPERMRTVIISLACIGILPIVALLATDIGGNMIYRKRCETFSELINEANVTDARKVLESVNFNGRSNDKYDMALLLIEAYISSGDVAGAIEIYDLFTSEHCPAHNLVCGLCHGNNNDYELKATELIVNALIGGGDYDKAWQYHPKVNFDESDYGNAQPRFEFMTAVVQHLCDNNKISEAKVYVKNNLAWFQTNVDVLKKDSDYKNNKKYQEVYKLYNSYKVRTSLMQVISNH